MFDMLSKCPDRGAILREWFRPDVAISVPREPVSAVDWWTAVSTTTSTGGTPTYLMAWTSEMPVLPRDSVSSGVIRDLDAFRRAR